MRVYKLQRFRGGWAIATYEDGARISRRQLPATDPAEAGRQFDRLVGEYAKPERPSVAAIWDAFRNHMADRPIATTMGFERAAVLGHFGEMEPVAIDAAACRAYAAARRALGRKDGTIWTELGHLRTALRWAERTGMIDKAPHVERPEKPDPKERYLTREEAARLLDAAVMPHVRLFIVLAIATAARSGALLELTWSRIDFERGTIRLAGDDLSIRRKGRATVPMNAMARAALLEAQAGARTPFVIEWAGHRVRKIRHGITSAAERAGLAGVTPHVFRHTAAVWMAEDGHSMAEIAQYLGHADSRITERVYARFSPGHLREAAKALEFGNLRSARGFK
jgi:integrase